LAAIPLVADCISEEQALSKSTLINMTDFLVLIDFTMGDFTFGTFWLARFGRF